MGVFKSAVQKRIQGDKPSPVHAVLASAVAGAAVAVTTYRLMRK
jgi:hypothetical protein